MIVEPGVDVRSEDKPVEHLFIADDKSEQPVMVTHRSLAWSTIERVGRYAVRLRDFAHPFVANFGPLPYFDIEPSLRVPATLHRYDEPKVANVGTVIEGLGYHPTTPGTVSFTLPGGALSGYSVSVDCSSQSITEGANSYTLYSLSATGSHGVLGDQDYAFRTVLATVAL